MINIEDVQISPNPAKVKQTVEVVVTIREVRDYPYGYPYDYPIRYDSMRNKNQ